MWKIKQSKYKVTKQGIWIWGPRFKDQYTLRQTRTHPKNSRVSEARKAPDKWLHWGYIADGAVWSFFIVISTIASNFDRESSSVRNPFWSIQSA